MTTRDAPPPEPPAWGLRRSGGGARRELTERVTLRAPGFEATGWTLNASRGGLRAIVEAQLATGVDYEVVLGDDKSGRAARLVWSKDAQDGQIIGLQYLDGDGPVPAFDDPEE